MSKPKRTPPTVHPDEILSLEEVAELTGLATTTLKHHLKKGTLKGKKVGRDWAFLRSQVEGFVPPPRGRRWESKAEQTTDQTKPKAGQPKA